MLYSLGIEPDLFTTMFAMSRVVGWTGHLLEQYADNRLIRPRSEYVGPMDLEWVPIDERK
jgi:citrate synthase